MNKLISSLSVIILLVIINSLVSMELYTEPSSLYIFPEEGSAHEGTWLQWPHHHQYGLRYRQDLDPTWVAITHELIESEMVHIIAYDQVEKNRIIRLLQSNSIPLDHITFNVYPTDDFWIRDNGPIYVRNQQGALVIQDWGFNAWGEKAAYEHCNTIPQKIAQDQGRTIIDLNEVMINEGGSVELDGRGTLMACRSSILNPNRNPNLSQQSAESVFTTYLGASNFIWLEGQAGLEITDQHIDGFARFADAKTIVTMSRANLKSFDVLSEDIRTLYEAKDSDGTPYDFLILPLTKHNVVTTYGKNLGYQGSYCNYYIANTKVLVPTYNDPNDKIALQILAKFYPDREVVGIDSRNLYANGGMIHCITQQQHVD